MEVSKSIFKRQADFLEKNGKYLLQFTVRYPSDKLSLTAANELLYDGQLYTGKILLGEKGYINLTNGDLDGETFFENIDTKYNDFKILKEEFNILNGVPEGRTHSELKIGNSDGGYSYFNIEIYWKDGKIQRHKVTNPVSETDIVFDLEGKGNSIGKDKKKFKDGIAKFDGKIFKCNLNEEKNEIIYSTFDKNNKLIDQEIVSDNKDILRESLFDTLIRGIE